MRRTSTSAVVVILLSACLLAREKAPQPTKGPVATEDDIAVFFSPDGGCRDAIIAQLNGAKKTVDVQAYTFTSKEIADAMAAAKNRGVKVRVICDKKESGKEYSAATLLAMKGVETYTDSKHPIAHNKIIIIDEQIIITGSFNFTKAAEESNAENLLIINGKKKLVAAYEKNFAEHLQHSQRVEGTR